MWLNAPANHGLARTGKPPQLVNMFPHYLAMIEIPKESTHHIDKFRRHQGIPVFITIASTLLRKPPTFFMIALNITEHHLNYF